MEYINVQGGQIFVKTWSGKTKLAPIILLNDSLGSADLWGQFCDTLGSHTTNRYRYDRLGFGRSTERKELPSSRFVSEEAEIYFPAISQLRYFRLLFIRSYVGGGMSSYCFQDFRRKRLSGLLLRITQALLKK